MARRANIAGETVWLLNEQPEMAVPRLSPSQPAMRDGSGKNPAVAFSLSLWVWGGGQFYNRQWQLGLFYLLAMVNFYLFPAVIMHDWTAIESGLATLDIPASEIMAALGIFCLTGLMVWIINAVQAYNGAVFEDAAPFEGVRNPLLPAACSLLIPGWGQFLNGQAKKGACLLIAAMAGLFAVAVALAVPFLWPTLNTEMDRRFAEGSLIVAWLLVPPVLLVWCGGVYDAVTVSIDPLKKQPIKERMEAAISRMRMNGWHGLLSRLKLTLVLGLYLVFSLAVSRYYFPQDYYAALLNELHARTAQQHMVIIPRRIDQLNRIIFPSGPRR